MGYSNKNNNLEDFERQREAIAERNKKTQKYTNKTLKELHEMYFASEISSIQNEILVELNNRKNEIDILSKEEKIQYNMMLLQHLKKINKKLSDLTKRYNDVKNSSYDDKNYP